MSHTVIGIFEQPQKAQEVKKHLLTNGFNDSQIDISNSRSEPISGSDHSSTGSNQESRGIYNQDAGANQNRTGTYNQDNRGSQDGQGAYSQDSRRTEREDTSDSVGNFFRNLFDDEEEARRHAEAGRRGSIVTVHATSLEEARTASRILDQYGALDANDYSEKNRLRGSAESSRTETDTIPVIEEEMQVGKREVESGGVRVRSRIIEKPIEEKIRLRSEHIRIERNPANRPATEEELNSFREGTVEVTEHSEVPVVNKESRVVEEVNFEKEVEENEETIRDSVRKTQVDTEDFRENEDGRSRNTDRTEEYGNRSERSDYNKR
jgi:stress response protein YsnF